MIMRQAAAARHNPQNSGRPISGAASRRPDGTAAFNRRPAPDDMRKKPMPFDLRDAVFSRLDEGEPFTAVVFVYGEGVVCGVDSACNALAALDCAVLFRRRDGDVIDPQSPALVFSGAAKAVAVAEDTVVGHIAKATGVARAAARAVGLADRHSGGVVRIVSGSAKKLPRQIRALIKHAVRVGGAFSRMVEGPFLYLDKNYVRMFGSVGATLDGVAHMRGLARVVQLRGELEPLEAETTAALEKGAECLMVDTGDAADLDLVSAVVRKSGRRDSVTLAFAGDVTHADIPALCAHDLDVIGLGRSIVDAPLADCSLDVTRRNHANATPGQAGEAGCSTTTTPCRG